MKKRGPRDFYEGPEKFKMSKLAESTASRDVEPELACVVGRRGLPLRRTADNIVRDRR